MEMQVWMTLSPSNPQSVVNGETIPLKNNIFTSIERMVHEINKRRKPSDKIERVVLDEKFKVKLKFICWMVNDDEQNLLSDLNSDYLGSMSNSSMSDHSDDIGLPVELHSAVNKTIQDIGMIIKDEVVAARRLQAVINSDILDFVTSHIREHHQDRAGEHARHTNPPNSTSSYDLDNQFTQTVTNLQCTFTHFPLRFVNCEGSTPYNEAIGEFKDLLRSRSLQNRFGNVENGFSLPDKLFDHKDLKDDLSQYEFDLKNDSTYFYVILREKDECVPHGPKEMTEYLSEDQKSSRSGEEETEATVSFIDRVTPIERRSGILHTEEIMPPPQTFPSSSSSSFRPAIQDSNRENLFKPIYHEADKNAESVVNFVSQDSNHDNSENSEDREVRDILEKGAHKVPPRQTLKSSNSRGSILSSSRSGTDLRRESNYKVFDDDVDAVKPDFWLILEITTVDFPDENRRAHDKEYFEKHRFRPFCPQGPAADNIPDKYPVINIYHHRRTADQPMLTKVMGDPIPVIRRETELDPEILKSMEKVENLTRDRNLTDADKEFIEQISQYIQNLVKHVNQAYLLKQLGIDQRAMLILMEQDCSTLDEESDVNQKFNNTEFGCFQFEPGEFEPQVNQSGFGESLVWTSKYKIRPRIATIDKSTMMLHAVAGIKSSKLFSKCSVVNRRNMYIFHINSECQGCDCQGNRDIYYFLVNPDDEDIMFKHEHSRFQRTLSSESEDSIPYITRNHPRNKFGDSSNM